jgi:hypothetical protein
MKFFSSSSLLALAAVLLLTPTGASAQGSNPLDPTVPRSQVLVGPTVGVTRNYHTGGFRTIDDPNCPLFEDGSGWGIIAGITAEFQPAPTWSLIPRVTYQTRPAQFSQNLPDAQVLLPGATDPVNQTVTTSSTITYSLLVAEIMYKYEVFKIGKGLRVGLEAGPAFGYVLGGKNRQVQDLLEPQNARFVNPEHYESENNGRRLILFDKDIPQRKSTRFSLKGGLQVEIGLFGNSWIATPAIYYDYGLTAVTDAENWNLNSLMFQLDFRRAF